MGYHPTVGWFIHRFYQHFQYNFGFLQSFALLLSISASLQTPASLCFIFLLFFRPFAILNILLRFLLNNLIAEGTVKAILPFSCASSMPFLTSSRVQELKRGFSHTLHILFNLFSAYVPVLMLNARNCSD